MGVNGKFAISVYTIRPIAYGEELTFDYNSVTESQVCAWDDCVDVSGFCGCGGVLCLAVCWGAVQEEYNASVCLCSDHDCRGLFLYYASSKTFQEVCSICLKTAPRSLVATTQFPGVSVRETMCVLPSHGVQVIGTQYHVMHRTADLLTAGSAPLTPGACWDG